MAVIDLQRPDVRTVFKALQDRRRTPLSTYRLQMRRLFMFKDATAIIPYLSRLGIADCYTSPVLKAKPGSTHGYDITNHNVLNPELGSEEDYQTFIHTLQTHQMGCLLDFVPNHMGIDAKANPWWWDVLENGPSSPYAGFFDIDWSPIKPELKNKVLLPILGDQYGAVLERGELQLKLEKGRVVLYYFDHRLPTNPRQMASIFRWHIEALQADMKEDSNLREFLSILTELEHLPPITERRPDRIQERQREKTVAQERLERVLKASPRVRHHIEECLAVLNGHPGDPRSFDALHQFLEAQAYRLAYWKTALHEINYRRFFDVNQLAGLCMERNDVFDATHRRILSELARGHIAALRIDHPDGLYDPAGYFESLQNAFLREWVHERYANDFSLPDMLDAIQKYREDQRRIDPSSVAAKPLYVVAEKILSTGESLRKAWSIDGTSGYDFLNQVSQLFVNPANERPMKEFYARFTGRTVSVEEELYRAKKLIMSTTMASELNVLAHMLNGISETNRIWRDFTLDSLRDVLREMIACFPVYRTYISPETVPSPSDELVITKAIGEAKRLNPALESTIFDFVHAMLVPQRIPELLEEDYERRLQFTMKFQQYTGPVQAKGLEDTTFYRHIPLLSLNEVGADPSRFGFSISDFHQANEERQRFWPHTMLATATHDTKRGEDARVRLHVLSEIPEEWEEMVFQWASMNRPYKTSVDNDLAPDANDEYLFYQTLLGTWAGDTTSLHSDELRQRLQAYLQKALREAKRRTSWIRPNEAYEKAMEDFVDHALRDRKPGGFLATFEPFARRVASLGRWNSLSQLILKMTSPGIPDFYQGGELWDWSLVDPDNRRPVDYVLRERLLEDVERALQESHSNRQKIIEQWLDRWEDGRIKLYVTLCGLQFRRKYSDLFMEGSYVPLVSQGAKSEHIVAFGREYAGHRLVVVAPRFLASFSSPSEFWGDTRIPFSSEWRIPYQNILTGEEIAPGQDNVKELLKNFPLAILSSER